MNFPTLVLGEYYNNDGKMFISLRRHGEGKIGRKNKKRIGHDNMDGDQIKIRTSINVISSHIYRVQINMLTT